MRSSSPLAAAKIIVRWLRWAVVLALVSSALGELVYWALGAEGRDRRPVPVAVVQNLVFMFVFALKDAAFIVAGAKIAPWFRRTTAIVLAAMHVPLSLWVNVLSRVSFVEFVLLEGAGNYGQFTLEALGTLLGVAYIFCSEKAGPGPFPSSPTPLPEGEGRNKSKPAPQANLSPERHRAAKTVIHCLRWAVVLVLLCSELSDLVDTALAGLVFSALGAPAPRPVPLAVVQELVFTLRFHVLREMAVVVAGALIAPRFRLATAIVLAALHVSLYFWGHVLATGGPWWFWTINYTHFSLEALGSVLGVLYIFWSERSRKAIKVRDDASSLGRCCSDQSSA